MAFDVNTITLQGAIAVASATVSNKLVIDGCDATTDVLTQAQAAQIATRPATPGSTTTEIALAGSTDNHVFAYAEFLLGESTGGDFNSFFLYGHLEDDSSTVFVISVCSSANPVRLPATGDVTNRTEVQFDLTFTPNAEVVKVADTSMYCTRGEFLILKERAVTTHAEGTPTTGEAQSIYGQKTFKNGIKTDSISAATSTATYITIPRIENTQIKTDYIFSKTDNEKVTFATGIKTSWISPTTTNYVEFTHKVRASEIGDKTHGTALYAKTIDNDSSGTSLIITGHSAINDDANDLTAQLTIGRYDSQVSHVGFKFEGFNPDTSNYSSFIVTGYSVGTLGSPVDTIYANKLRNCVLPSFQIGSVELGAILLIRIVSDANVTLYAGTDITNGQSQTISGVTITPVTSYAAIDVTASGVFLSGGNSSDIAVGIMWRLLSTAFMTSFLDSGVTKYQGYALAMRIE